MYGFRLVKRSFGVFVKQWIILFHSGSLERCVLRWKVHMRGDKMTNIIPDRTKMNVYICCCRSCLVSCSLEKLRNFYFLCLVHRCSTIFCVSCCAVAMRRNRFNININLMNRRWMFELKINREEENKIQNHNSNNIKIIFLIIWWNWFFVSIVLNSKLILLTVLIRFLAVSSRFRNFRLDF